MNRTLTRTLALALALASVVACASASDGAPTQPTASANPGASSEVDVDTVEIVHGVPDKGRDPAVVAIDIGGIGLCSGTLIASNVVLTARHCVSETLEHVQCPSNQAQVTSHRDPASLTIYSGDDVSTAHQVARGVEVFVPHSQVLCDNDIAAIVLDQDVDIEPISVSKISVTVGMPIRAIGYGKSGDNGSAGIKLRRDHVKVLQTSPAEFLVGESTCQGDSGGPALDESGELVGVVSRGGPSCDGKNAHNVYTRANAFNTLIEEALKAGSLARKGGKDGGTSKSKKPTTDMGDPCTSGKDCSSGVCVKTSSKAYCSRTCGTGDRCPAGYNCKHPKSGPAACIAK